MSIDPFLPARILMTTDTVGGVWHYSLDLAEALGEYSIQVDLATLGPWPTSLQRESAEMIPNLTLHPSEFRLEWMNDPWEDVHASAAWLKELERKLEPDLIHFNHYGHGSKRWDAPTLTVVHSDVLSWFRAVRKTEAPPSWDRYRSEVTRGLRSSDAVIAPTRTMLKSAEDDYGPFRKSHVIPNARFFAEKSAPAKKKPCILTVGRIWDEAKNIGLLNDIAPALPWPVFAAGNAKDPNDGDLKKFSSISTLGELEPALLASQFESASIYALPARYEPFGLSVLEAARAGCALVLGNIPSLRENWEGSALFVDPESHNDWTLALNTLIHDHGKRAALGELARKRSKAFDLAKTAALYVREYRHLMKTRLPFSQDQFISDRRLET